MVVDNSWKSFISCHSPSAGKMYGLVKIHKVINPVRILTSGCNTVVQNLSTFVENVLYKKVEKISSRIRGTSLMLDITTDNLNDSDLSENSVLVIFDIAKMFPSINNESRIKTVNVLSDGESKYPVYIY